MRDFFFNSAFNVVILYSPQEEDSDLQALLPTSGSPGRDSPLRRAHSSRPDGLDQPQPARVRSPTEPLSARARTQASQRLRNAAEPVPARPVGWTVVGRSKLEVTCQLVPPAPPGQMAAAAPMASSPLSSVASSAIATPERPTPQQSQTPQPPQQQTPQQQAPALQPVAQHAPTPYRAPLAPRVLEPLPRPQMPHSPPSPNPMDR